MYLLESTSGWSLSKALGDAVGISNDPYQGPHHPMYCSKTICYYENGSMSCPHSTTKSGTVRVQHAVDLSIAALLIELAGDL